MSVHRLLDFYGNIPGGEGLLPMKGFEREMSPGAPCYERDLLNVLRHGRSVPAVPLVLIGVAPQSQALVDHLRLDTLNMA